MDMSLGFPQLVLETKEGEEGCPMYDSDNKNCQVHHDMPLNCQAYPLGYNGEKYLVEAIESVLNQTFANFELLKLNSY